MAMYAVAAFLLVYGMIAFGLAIPLWVAGLVALIAAGLIVAGK